MTKQYPAIFAVVTFLLIQAIGCGKLPLISENRKNFPPWEKLPEGNGISYVGKFVKDAGHDPLYLAKIEYDDEADLQRVIDTFGLVLHPTIDSPSSFVDVLEKTPPWYPLKKVTHLYVFPDSVHQYVANLWVNENEKTMIIERTWW